MTAVDPRSLKPGQRVRVTFRAVEGVVSDEHQGVFSVRSADNDLHGFRADEVASVEVLAPSLPTEVGKRIVAMAPEYASEPVVLTLARGTEWLSVCGDAVLAGQITEWALLEGVHTVRTSEPDAEPEATLPTGLGAVVRATVGTHRGTATLAHPGTVRSWVFTYSDTTSTGWGWESDVALADVEVLSPGIEVPSPTTPEEV